MHTDGAPKLSLVEDKGDGKRRGKGVYAHNLSEHEACYLSQSLPISLPHRTPDHVSAVLMATASQRWFRRASG